MSSTRVLVLIASLLTMCISGAMLVEWGVRYSEERESKFSYSIPRLHNELTPRLIGAALGLAGTLACVLVPTAPTRPGPAPRVARHVEEEARSMPPTYVEKARAAYRRPPLSAWQFSWWWPSTGVGIAVMSVLMGLAFLAPIFSGRAGLLDCVVGAFIWYVVATALRFLFLKATGFRPC